MGWSAKFGLPLPCEIGDLKTAQKNVGVWSWKLLFEANILQNVGVFSYNSVTFCDQHNLLWGNWGQFEDVVTSPKNKVDIWGFSTSKG